MFTAKIRDDLIKKFVLGKGLDSEWAQAHKLLYKGDDTALIAFSSKYGIDVYRVSRNLNESRYNRYKKCKSKVGSIIEGGCAWFGTLTFKNEVLESTTQQTRRRYVSRLLKGVSSCYVANIDFGDKLKNPDSNEREHYHFVCYSEDKPNLESWKEKYGFVKCVKCGCAEKDIKKVCKYTAKLSHHALKASTELGVIGGIPRLIYSRGKFNIAPQWLFDD